MKLRQEILGHARRVVIKLGTGVIMQSIVSNALVALQGFYRIQQPP